MRPHVGATQSMPSEAQPGVCLPGHLRAKKPQGKPTGDGGTEPSKEPSLLCFQKEKAEGPSGGVCFPP